MKQFHAFQTFYRTDGAKSITLGTTLEPGLVRPRVARVVIDCAMRTRRVDDRGTAKRVRRIGEWCSLAGTSEEEAEEEGEGRPTSEEETAATAIFFGRGLLFIRKISEGC